MNQPHLITEFLATPWALMPERLNAMAAVLGRWSQNVPASDGVLATVAADRAVREAHRQATAAQSAGGIAVLPLYGVVTQRGNMVEDVSGPGSVSTQQFAADSWQLPDLPAQRSGGLAANANVRAAQR